MDDLTRLLVAVRDDLADVGPSQLVLVACSGGPDSLALAGAAARLAPPRGWRVGGVVVDHGWSEAGRYGSALAHKKLQALGLDPVELIQVDSSAAGDGPEAAARAARYQALDDAAERLGAVAVLLGHTLDDQAETVLLGLARGSGARSLAGMPRRRGVYRRPLLGLRREVTLAACAALDLEPWHDPANFDDRYTRVRVRKLAGALEQALGPGTAEGLARTADLLREDGDALDALAGQVLDQARPASSTELILETVVTTPDAIRRRVLLAAAREATRELTGQAPALTRAHALALDALLTGGDQGETHLPSGVIAVRAYGKLQFRLQPS